MKHICTACGHHDNAADVIERDGFMIDPSGDVRFEGRAIPMTPQQRGILHVLASRAGRTCSRNTIIVAGNSDGTPQTVDVQICRVRHQLRDAGAPIPFNAVRGEGYRWTTPQHQAQGA